MTGRLAPMCTLLAATFALAVASPPPAVANTGCDRVAALNGSDSAAGTASDPFRTAQKLVSSLSSGQAGCLRAGTYDSDPQVKIATAGIRLTSYPGERAKLVGRLWIAQGADGATVDSLDLNGRNAKNLPSPTVNANDTVFRGNDVTNDHTAICFNLGHSSYGRADRTLIEDNRIHNCGALPATNHHHGIYASQTDGSVIRGNWIYDNADRGIQLYPNADNTTVTANVIDGNGQGIIFSGSSGQVSSGNVVERNAITNSTIRHNVESHWGDGEVGTGNVARENCVHGGTRDDGDGGIETPQEGFTAADNLLVDPMYVDAGAKNFELSPSSPCAGLLAGVISSSDELTPEGSPENGDTPTTEDVDSGETADGSVTLKTKKRKVRSGRKVALRGKATVQVNSVWIFKKKGRNWRKVSRAKTRGGGGTKFRTRARVRGSRKTKFRAMTTSGEKSRPVRVRVRG